MPLYITEPVVAQSNMSRLVTVIGCVKQSFILAKKSEWLQLCYLHE